jgi:hypothetical protein
MFLHSCSLIRQETFLIPSENAAEVGLDRIWNPKCTPLGGDEVNPIFTIPEDGFLCTSSARYSSYYRRSYYSVDEEGNRTMVKQSEKIRHEGTLTKKEPSLDKGQPDCNVTLDQFFYGSKEDLKENNPIFEDENFLTNYHPECRNTGVRMEKKKA